MIRFVFLDLDDTLFDFGASEHIALGETLRHFGVEPTPEVMARYSVHNLAQWKLLEQGKLTRDEVKTRRFRLLFDELGLPCDPRAMTAYYEQRLSLSAILLPGAEALLDELYGKYKLYVVSNATVAVQNGRIASSGIAKYFERIFLSEQVGSVKPQKEFFDRCFAEIPDFDPAQSILLGDSLTSDIQGGINAGIRTCWFDLKQQGLRGDIRPDCIIRTLPAFAELLRTL